MDILQKELLYTKNKNLELNIKLNESIIKKNISDIETKQKLNDLEIDKQQKLNDLEIDKQQKLAEIFMKKLEHAKKLNLSDNLILQLLKENLC